MNCKVSQLAAMAAALVIMLGIAATASAQGFTGRIDVTVEDSTGGRLPGVSVDITGPTNQTQPTDAQGQAHFLNLPVGTFTVKANLSGFNPYTNANVQVAAAAATAIAIKLGVAGTAEVVNVTAATPVIDTKRQTTTTNVTLEELQNIPTARDPWVVMQSVPSIYVDRVNVGGSESGQQSNYQGKGSTGTDNTWSIDGVPITDMGATGSTPTYFDFDMFQEMAITTGGADAQNATPGVQLNMVLKKGQNTPHGNARYYFENQNLQATNIPSDLAATLGGTSGKGNRTDFYKDYGFDLGGPILKDRLWGWGSVGRTNVRNLTLTGTPDQTILKNYALKVDGQITASTRGNFTFFEGDKVKFGRSAGPQRPAETTLDQSGPTKYYKGEGNFVVGQSLFVAARYAYISGGFGLTPEGGTDAQMFKDDGGVWHNSYYFFRTNRPQYFGGGDASYFKGKHELKFGFSWRRTPVDSLSGATGNRIVSIATGYPNMAAYAEQDFASSTVGKYAQAFITDTISLNRLTITAGVRYDRQTSSYAQTSVPAVAGFPLLPAVTAQAVNNAYKFTNLTPRVGITYALDDSRKTIARASYAMFASQLPANAGAFVASIQPYTYIYYNAVDLNGNHVADPNEIDFGSGVQGSNNVDLAHPGVVSTNNRIGNITAPLTQEAMFGVDREIAGNFGVSATFTYRHMNDFLWNPANGVTPASYTQTGTFTGTFPNVGSVSVPFFGSPDALPGYTAQNRPDYYRRYLGFELSATKRMSNHWMARLGFGSSSWTEHFGSGGIMDPTPTSNTSGQFANLQASGPLINGGPVVVQTAGSGKSGIYLIAPKYQLSANGMYQGPWGIDIGASLNLRQGYGEPFFRSRVNTNDSVVPLKNLLLVAPDANRLATESTLDARLEKMFKFQRTSLALDLDVFNLLNNATVLGIQYDARLTTFGATQEIMNPRIARLGVRFFF
jgi:carboxypeptidase family protein/TonB-dependent receptor-like protein